MDATTGQHDFYVPTLVRVRAENAEEAQQIAEGGLSYMLEVGNDEGTMRFAGTYDPTLAAANTLPPDEDEMRPETMSSRLGCPTLVCVGGELGYTDARYFLADQTVATDSATLNGLVQEYRDWAEGEEARAMVLHLCDARDDEECALFDYFMAGRGYVPLGFALEAQQVWRG